jgi:polysaccharide biosynthesis transport protein
MITHADNQVTDAAAPRTIGPVQPEIADIFGIAIRGWLFIVAGLAAGLICAVMLLSVIAPVYKASSRIVFERTVSRYMQTNKVTNEPIIEDYDTLGQTYVISSESILLHVVRSLSLADDPDFVGSKDGQKLTSQIRGLFRNTAEALGLSKNSTENKGDSRDQLEKIALDTLIRNLTVGREDVQSVITVAFSWKDPVKAAAIVNGIVDAYIDASITSKIKSTKLAVDVVQERSEELKQQIRNADHALLDYKAANNLVGSDQITLTHGQIGILQTQLTNARLAMAEAKARMEQIPTSSDQISTSSDEDAILAPDNELVKKLRAELMDLSARANEIEKLVGKDHLAVVKIHNRMDEVRHAIASEQRRIAGSFGKEYRLARARYDELSEAVSQTVSSEGVNSNKQARLRELEGAAESLRSLHNRMLQQVSENNKVEAQPPITPDARVLMRAAPPLETEASKKRFLILAGGSVMGLLMGGAFLMIRSFPFGVFRTTTQVIQATGLACVVLPEIVDSKERASLAAGEHALDAPYSRFAQTMRSIGATISVAQRVARSKVICVVSSNPGEGKTTVAMNLAAHLGQRSTQRVLLVDADLYRQSLTRSVASDAQVGLKEALEEPAALAKFVVRKERLNLDVLPCPLPDRLPDPSALLEAAGLEQLIKVAREAYDLVIIEVPPMGAMVDYKIVARHCDGFILVVEWGKTSQRLVMECLSEASELLDRILCVILNKADPFALRSIEHYKGDRFHAYYADQKSA